VEFGFFTSHGQIHGLEAGTYLALLSHSGSRGTGAEVCDHYSKLAFSQFPDLPSELKRLAWLSLDSQEGKEYWVLGQFDPKLVKMTASGHSTLTLEGGTHNPMAPPFDFLARCFMPLIHRMGPSVELGLRRHGFFPAGGGRFHVLGGSLWTDFALVGNPVVSEVVAQTGMNDYRRIRTLPNYRRLKPSDSRGHVRELEDGNPVCRIAVSNASGTALTTQMLQPTRFRPAAEVFCGCCGLVLLPSRGIRPPGFPASDRAKEYRKGTDSFPNLRKYGGPRGI
jgi:hypothetical protein